MVLWRRIGAIGESHCRLGERRLALIGDIEGGAFLADGEVDLVPLLLGGAIGVLASLALGMVEFSILNFATFSEIVFTFRPTGSIIVIALVSGGGMGLLGGLLPALRASQVSPVEAMRG